MGIVPELPVLLEAFQRGAPDRFPHLDEHDRQVILLWEEQVRDHLLERAQAPTDEPYRWKLPEERRSLTHRFEIIDADGPPFKGYLVLGFYPNGRLGELFLEMSKEGAFASGVMDALVTCVSIGLQHGIPLEAFLDKFRHTKFVPAGIVRGAPEDLRGFAGSVLDYLAKFLSHRCPAGFLKSAEAYKREKTAKAKEEAELTAALLNQEEATP